MIGRAHIVSSGAFVLCGAKQIHTFGLDRSIDVALCDRDWRVLHVARRMPPNRFGRIVRKGHYAVETASGALEGVVKGDRLTLRDL